MKQILLLFLLLLPVAANADDSGTCGDNYPVAIVEAKSGSHLPDDGLQQAIEYAQVLGLLFAYSSNGQMFVEHDISTGKARTFPMDTFPTPEELKRRHEEALHLIVSHLDSLSAKVRELEAIQRKTLAECDALKQAMLREVFE